MMKQQREISFNDILHFPKDIQYLNYAGKTMAFAVETANWLVLPSDSCKAYLEHLRFGKSVGEVLGQIQDAGEKQVFIKLLTAIMARQFAGLDEVPEKEFVQGYRMLNIYLTNACNLSCPHCFMKAGKKLVNELTKDEWVKVLADFKNNGGESITITGGEPLMHPGFRDVIEGAYHLQLKITVLTNGLLWTDELIDELSPYLVEVQISIDGVDDASNGIIRKQGTFEQLVRNVIRFSHNGVRVSVATTFTNDNIDSASRYAELVHRIDEATDKKVFFKLTKKILPGRETHYTKAQNKEYEEIIRKVESTIDPNAKYEAFMDGHTPNLTARNCGFGGISISADGNVYFCNRILEIVSQGNVRDYPMHHFMQLGEKANMETSVDNVEPCRSCPLRYICGGGCRIDEYDFKGRTWEEGQVLRQLKCKGPSDYLLRMMVGSYEYKYSF